MSWNFVNEGILFLLGQDFIRTFRVDIRIVTQDI